MDFLEALLVLGSSRDAQWPPFLVHVLAVLDEGVEHGVPLVVLRAERVERLLYAICMLYAARKLVRRTLWTVEARQLFHVHLGFGALLL